MKIRRSAVTSLDMKNACSSLIFCIVSIIHMPTILIRFVRGNDLINKYYLRSASKNEKHTYNINNGFFIRHG